MNASRDVQLRELGSRMLLTPNMLRAAHDEALVKSVQRMQCAGFIRAMVVAGDRLSFFMDEPIEAEMGAYDPSSRAFEVNTVAWVDEDPRGAALLAKTLAHSDYMYGVLNAVNAVPLWKLLWFKLRRKPLVAA